jgi:succinate dehydrogenase cytochrome b556 subunit
MKITGYARERNQIAWAANIISGCAVIVYAVLHGCVIAALALGKQRFDGLIRHLASPWMTILEMAVITAVMYHFTNGIRLLLCDAGFWVEDERDMLSVALVIVLIVAGFHFLPYGQQLFSLIRRK